MPRGHGLNASADRLFVSVRPAATEDLFCREGVLVYSDFFEDNKLFRVDLNNWNVTKLDE